MRVVVDFEDLVKEVGGMDANVKGLALQIRSVIGIGRLMTPSLFFWSAHTWRFKGTLTTKSCSVFRLSYNQVCWIDVLICLNPNEYIFPAKTDDKTDLLRVLKLLKIGAFYVPPTGQLSCFW